MKIYRWHSKSTLFVGKGNKKIVGKGNNNQGFVSKNCYGKLFFKLFRRPLKQGGFQSDQLDQLDQLDNTFSCNSVIL